MSDPNNPIAEVPKAPLSGPRPARLWWLALLLGIFAINNLLCLPFFLLVGPWGRPSLPAFACGGLLVGGILSQVLTLSFFAVLGPGSALRRQCVVWLVAAMLIVCFTAGFAVGRWPAGLVLPLARMAGIWLSIPAVFCACQLPLWVLRYLFRWRASLSATHTDAGQISIGGMLLATAVVAIVLGMCRLGHYVQSAPWDPTIESDETMPAIEWWAAVGVAAGVAAIASTIILPTVSILTLRFRRAPEGFALAAAFLSGGTLAFVVIMSLATGDWPDSDGVVLLSMYFVGTAGYLFASLAIFRAAGYRLYWGRSG